MLYRKLRVAIINTPLEYAYNSYGDHWVDGFRDIGCEVTVNHYDNIQMLPLGYDLYFFVEIRYNPTTIPWYIYPRMLYSWDSHVIGLEEYKGCASCFDYVLLASKVDVDALRAQGHWNVLWIPEACNPHVHKDLGTHREFDVGYVGQQNASITRNGKTKYDFMQWLQENKKYKFLQKEGVWGPAYTEAQNSIKIMFDRTIGHNIGTRIFESCAAGCLPVWSSAGYSTGIEKLLVDGVHYVSYNDTIEDLESKLDYYLSHPEDMAAMIERAKKHVLAKHTYGSRALEVLQHLISQQRLTDVYKMEALT